MLEARILNRTIHNSVVVTAARSCFWLQWQVCFYGKVKWFYTLSKLLLIEQINAVIFDDTFLPFKWRHFLVTATFCFPVLINSAFSVMLVYSFSAHWYKLFAVAELMWTDPSPSFLTEELIQCLQGHTYPPSKTEWVVVLFFSDLSQSTLYKTFWSTASSSVCNSKILWAKHYPGSGTV